MIAALILAAGIQAGAVDAQESFDCRVVIDDLTLQSTTLDVDLTDRGAASNDLGRPIRVTVAPGGEAVFPDVLLPVTREATSRSFGPTEPGYVQFAVVGPDATYLVALHDAQRSGLPAALFISRSDHQDWRRSWYWAHGFCARRIEGVQ